VDISNAGGGTLDSVAEELRAWLALGATSGTAPATLGLTADPAGLEDSTVLTTTLWIASTAGTDPLTENGASPMSLLVGDVCYKDPGPFARHGHLPIFPRSFDL
jgi:hypothetical protein